MSHQITPPQLLVSVRNPAEACAALQGGCDVLDIKEPARGPLGAADACTIAAVAHEAAGQVPLSAALGELSDMPCDEASSSDARRRVDYVKLGLARAPRDWRARLAHQQCALGQQRFVAVAYADHARVDAPGVDAVLDWARAHHAAALLIDTAVKDGRGVFDWQSEAALRATLGRAKAHDLPVALAGSLREADLPRVRALGPHIAAVRGAACERSDRRGGITAARVRALRAALQAPAVAIDRRAG